MSLVSIIVPNFNKDLFVAETIQSVLNQTYNNWELIIVDDNSTDNSVTIIESFLKDGRITLTKFNESKGANFCRNMGIKQAKGDFIIFLDADDILSDTCIEYRVRTAKANTDGNLFVFGMTLFKKEIGDDNRKWLPTSTNPLQDFLKHKLPWAIMQPLWDKDFLIGLNGFDETFERLQDVELHTRALIHPTVKLYRFPEIIDCYYRIDETRRNFDMHKFLNRRAKSVSLYCDKFSDLVERENRKYILGTVVQTYWNLIFYYRRLEITKEQFNASKQDLFNNNLCKDLKIIKRFFLGIYFIYNYKFPRISGVNRIIENLIIFC